MFGHFWAFRLIGNNRGKKRTACKFLISMPEAGVEPARPMEGPRDFKSFTESRNRSNSLKKGSSLSKNRVWRGIVGHFWAFFYLTTCNSVFLVVNTAKALSDSFRAGPFLFWSRNASDLCGFRSHSNFDSTLSTRQVKYAVDGNHVAQFPERNRRRGSCRSCRLPTGRRRQAQG